MSVRTALAVACLSALASTQVTATYATFGSGCPGTGAGLGAMNIAPAIAATAFGAGNAIPLGWTPNVYQQVIPGGDLPTAFAIGGMALRRPRTGPVSHNFTVDVQIKLGYTTRWQGTFDPVFANNWDAGAPVTVLPRVQYPLPDEPVTPPSSPTEFFTTITFANPFAWVPAPGRNLLLEVTLFGNSFGNQAWAYPLDNVNGTIAQFGDGATATVANSGVRTFGMALGLVEHTQTAVPQLYSTDTPQIGNTFRVRIAQAAPSSFALLLLGLSDTQWNGTPLPFDLGAVGAPGCPLLVAGHDLRLLGVAAAGTASLQYSLPNDIYLLNLRFYNQALVLDAGANALGIAASNGGVGLVGNQ